MLRANGVHSRTPPGETLEASKREGSVISERAPATGTSVHAATAARGRSIWSAASRGKGRKSPIHFVRFASGAFEITIRIRHPSHLLVAATTGFTLVLVNRHLTYNSNAIIGLPVFVLACRVAIAGRATAPSCQRLQQPKWRTPTDRAAALTTSS